LSPRSCEPENHRRRKAERIGEGSEYGEAHQHGVELERERVVRHPYDADKRKHRQKKDDGIPVFPLSRISLRARYKKKKPCRDKKQGKRPRGQVPEAQSAEHQNRIRYRKKRNDDFPRHGDYACGFSWSIL
jgi:hypothetical protein